jgi:hypothetical protein
MLAGAEGPASMQRRHYIGCANFLQAPIKYEKSSPTTPVTNFPPPLDALSAMHVCAGEKPLLPFNIKVGRLLSLAAIYMLMNFYTHSISRAASPWRTHTKLQFFWGKIYNRTQRAQQHNGRRSAEQKSTAHIPPQFIGNKNK